MTDNHHPITPPPELIKQWWDNTHGAFYEFEAVAIQAARWGADQELDACCEWLLRSLPGYDKHYADYLRAARRPKPLSLKEQALAELAKIDVLWDTDEFGDETNAALDIIRRALEQLDD